MKAHAPVDLDTVPTGELVGRCRAGSQLAWSSLVRRFQRLVATVPRRAGLAEDDVADVFQATFVRLWEHLERLNDDTKVHAWLVTTAKHESLAVLRRHRRNRVTVAAPGDGDGDEGEDPLHALADPAPLAEEQLSELQQLHRLQVALARLDEGQRRFAELVLLHDPPLAYEAVALHLGMPVGSIGPTRARVLAKLRRLLGEEPRP